jgi:hypothetical protein
MCYLASPLSAAPESSDAPVSSTDPNFFKNNAYWVPEDLAYATWSAPSQNTVLAESPATALIANASAVDDMDTAWVSCNSCGSNRVPLAEWYCIDQHHGTTGASSLASAASLGAGPAPASDPRCRACWARWIMDWVTTGRLSVLHRTLSVQDIWDCLLPAAWAIYLEAAFVRWLKNEGLVTFFFNHLLLSQSATDFFLL